MKYVACCETHWSPFSMILVGFAICFAAATGRAESVDQDKAQFVIAGIRDGREQLRAGVFRIEGEQSVSAGGRTSRYPVSVYCSFDVEQGLVNFQRMQKLPWLEEGAMIEGGKEVQLRLIRRPECSYHFRGGIGPEALTIRKPDFPVESPILPIDVRVIGLTSMHEMDNSISFSKVIDTYSVEGLLKCQETDGLWELSWRFPNQGATVIRTVWVDERKDFAPIRWELRLDQDELDEQTQKWGHTSEVSWMKEEKAWVPTAARLERRNARRRCTYDLAINWESVNHDPAIAAFGIANMGLPGDTLVADYRAGRPVVLGTIDEVIGGPGLLVDTATGLSRQAILIGANVVFIVCLISILCVRRVRQRVARAEDT